MNNRWAQSILQQITECNSTVLHFIDSTKIICKTRRCAGCKKYQSLTHWLTQLLTTWNQEMLAHLKIRCPFAINWWNFLCWVDELMKLVNSYMECMRYLFIPAKCLICERGMQNYARVHPLSHGNFCINSKYSWFKHNLSSVLTFQLNCALVLKRWEK